MTDKKGEFSYESPQKQQKRALSLFLVGLIIVVVVIIAIIVGLNYTGIFPISRLFPGLFGGLPTNQNIAKQIDKIFVDPNQPAVKPSEMPSDYDPNAKPSLDAVSDIKGYKIEIRNKTELISLLQEWGIYESEFSTRYGAYGSTSGKPVKNIVVHFTNKEQKTFIFSSNNVTYSSTETKINPGRLDVNVQLADGILNNPSKKDKLGLELQVFFLMAMYKTKNEAKTKDESQKINQEIQAILKSNQKTKNEYFVINKI